MNTSEIFGTLARFSSPKTLLKSQFSVSALSLGDTESEPSAFFNVGLHLLPFAILLSYSALRFHTRLLGFILGS